MTNKYNARRVKEDGHTFDSAAEHRRYKELKLLLAAGQITDLRVHPRYNLHAENKAHQKNKIGSYVADFCYNAGANEQLLIEDVKGFRTPMYRWKKRHFEAEYDLKITEISV